MLLQSVVDPPLECTYMVNTTLYTESSCHLSTDTWRHTVPQSQGPPNLTHYLLLIAANAVNSIDTKFGDAQEASI